MTVGSIVTQPRHPVPDSVPKTARGRRLARLGRLDADGLYMSMAFLAGLRPSVFDAVLDATESCAGDEPDPCRDPEPFCTECGACVGIFWLLGEEWHHFRPGADPGGKPEVYDPGHEPVIGWRTVKATQPGLTV
jgi:hypothetical protein